jgi:hypothetical protein
VWIKVVKSIITLQLYTLQRKNFVRNTLKLHVRYTLLMLNYKRKVRLSLTALCRNMVIGKSVWHALQIILIKTAKNMNWYFTSDCMYLLYTPSADLHEVKLVFAFILCTKRSFTGKNDFNSFFTIEFVNSNFNLVYSLDICGVIDCCYKEVQPSVESKYNWNSLLKHFDLFPW